MDIQITYETLFDLLRKERSLDELQPLGAQFWSQVVTYIKERENNVQQSNTFEQDKAKIQLANIKRIIKEIYERREQKIVRLALNITRSKTSQYIDKRNMLGSERAFFDDQTELLKKYNQGVLLQIFNGQLPLIAPEILDEAGEEGTEEDTKDTEITLPEEETAHERDSNQKSRDQNNETKHANNKSSPEPKVGSIIVRFTTNIPKFVGKNKELFGPYDQGNIAQLPANIAQILLKKGKVEHVMAEQQ